MFFLNLIRSMQNFEKLGFPTFADLGQGKPALRNSLPVISQLSGEMLAHVVRRKGATACNLDRSGWRELKVLPVAWFDGLARILSKVEEGSGLMVCWMRTLP